MVSKRCYEQRFANKATNYGLQTRLPTNVDDKLSVITYKNLQISQIIKFRENLPILRSNRHQLSFLLQNTSSVA